MNLQTAADTPGKRIKRRRLELNLTMAQVAEETGVTRMSISLWESDKTNISAANLRALAKVLKCGADWIMDGKEKRYDHQTKTTFYLTHPAETANPDEFDVEKTINMFRKLPVEEQKRLSTTIMERFDYYEQLYTELLEKLERKTTE